MAVPTPAPNDDPVSLLTAALNVLDRVGEITAAAYVSMALAQVKQRSDVVSKR